MTFAQRKPFKIRASGVVQHLKNLHSASLAPSHKKARRMNGAPFPACSHELKEH
jgi:hypothetical protein